MQELSETSTIILEKLKVSEATEQVLPGKTKHLEEYCTNLLPDLPSSLAHHWPPPTFRY
jgi:hypothetical protein